MNIKKKSFTQNYLQVLGIDEPLSLSTCQFIKEDDLQRYSPATAMISNNKLIFDSEFDLKFCFDQLLSYREQIEQILCFGSGAYHIGFLLGQGTYQKIWQFSGMIKERIVDIDKLLVAFISPGGKSFSVEDLIRDYDFPDVDIHEIDMEHL
ncbi:MAG: hypothetical protein PHZ02_15470 [Desulfocapsaceae bacterium]|nr:hypothetical protein [Desulfocapsaceae bacterium]